MLLLTKIIEEINARKLQALYNTIGNLLYKDIGHPAGAELTLLTVKVVMQLEEEGKLTIKKED